MTAGAAIRPFGKCRILVIGDSLGSNLGWGLLRQLQGTPGLTIVNKARSSTGLSNSWYYDWAANLPSMLRKYRPHLVVAMFGANDKQRMTLGGSIAEFGSPAWVNVYSAKVRKLVQLATDSGAYLAWVKLPVMSPPKYRRGMEALNSYYDAVVPQVPGTALVSTWDYFADSAGRYRESVRINGRLTKIRGDDGIHFSTLGQSVLATFAIKQLRASFHIDLKARYPKTITG